MMTAKGRAKLARAEAIQKTLLKFLRKHGRWTERSHGPDVLKYEDSTFLVMFYVKDPVPIEFRKKFKLRPLHHGLYGLDVWQKAVGKVLNLGWDSVGATPRITTFRRGDWEEVFLPFSGEM
jgi:hypothetical protein